MTKGEESGNMNKLSGRETGGQKKRPKKDKKSS